MAGPSSGPITSRGWISRKLWRRCRDRSQTQRKTARRPQTREAYQKGAACAMQLGSDLIPHPLNESVFDELCLVIDFNVLASSIVLDSAGQCKLVRLGERNWAD